MNPKRILLTILAALLTATVCLAEETPPRETVPGIANVRDFGAKGDGRTDDTEAFQAAINSLDKPKNKSGWSKAGGVVGVSNGWYKVLGPLDIPCGNIRIEGTGSTSIRDRSCWIYFTGTEGPLFRFPHDARSPEGFSIQHILLVGKGASRPTTAFELWTGPAGRFGHGLVFEDMGVYHFGTALAVKRKSGAGYQIGYTRINRCNWSRCGQAVVFDGATSVNGLSITGCVMRQCRPTPVKPALDIKAFNFVIRESSLEGSPFALLVRDSEDVSIHDNFFEGNKNIAIRVVDSEDVSIGGSRYYGDDAGKTQCKNVTRLELRAPEGEVALEDCRIVDWPGGLGTWRGVVSTEIKK